MIIFHKETASGRKKVPFFSTADQKTQKKRDKSPIFLANMQ